MACHFYAFLTVSLWASAYVGTKAVLDSFSAGSLGLLRCLIAAAVLGGVMLARKTPWPAPSDYPWVLLSGAFGLALYLLLFNRGAASIGPSTSCIIVSLSPILTALFACFLFREQIRFAGWLAMGLAFTGILIMSLWDGSLEVNPGIVWTLGAALCISIYNIIQRKLAGRLGALAMTACGFIAASLLLLFFLPDLFTEMAAAPADRLAIACFLGIFPSAISYLAWGKALAIAPKTSLVTNYMFLTPFISVLLEYAFTGGYPDAGSILGGAAILAGLLLFTVAGKR